MWQVDNRTPFAAERGWVRDRNGAEIWLVALKCTFDIGPDGTTAVSREQPPVLRTAEYHGDPLTSSLRYESDLVLTKMTTDVIVNGHAYAPGGVPVAKLDVGFGVGPVKKVLRVYGDRTWGTLGFSQPRSFVKMPIIYERAFGGADASARYPDQTWEWRNPVGSGFALAHDHLRERPIPNIMYPGEEFNSYSDRPRPAGYGVVASHWQQRAAFAGTYDDAWMNGRQPLLPHNFDERFFQVVPPDQQAPTFLRGGELATLRRLTPGGQLDFRLPRLFPAFETRFFDGTREIHKERKLHTIIIEADYPRVSLVWHSALPCHFKVQKLDRTIVRLKADIGSDARTGAAAELDLA